jgi:flagellar protein FlbB
MPAFGKPRVLGRILVMIAIIIALVLGGLVWFDYLGLLRLKDTFAPAYRLLGIPARRTSSLPADSATLLEDERTAKLYEALDAAREELSTRSKTLDEREAEIARAAQEIEEQRKGLEDREKSFNQTVESIENRKANVDQNARYLTGMPPAKAVEILKSMDDQMIIDVLRAVEVQAKEAGTDSVVAYWLSLMPPERSAAIQRKMTSKPEMLD